MSHAHFRAGAGCTRCSSIFVATSRAKCAGVTPGRAKVASKAAANTLDAAWYL